MQTAAQDELRGILEKMREQGLWQPSGLGLSYVKEGHKTVKLISQENISKSADARARMKILIERAGWKVDESICEIIEVTHLSSEEKQMREIIEGREVAQSWECTCGTLLSSFPLEEGVWKKDGQQETILPNGEAEVTEQWSVTITCPVCDMQVPLEPYDYGLLADSECMLSYKTSKMIYTIVNRPNIIETIDNNFSESMIILGSFCPFHGDLLPPHFRGVVCFYSAIKEE